ncbi:MAG: Gldg family protein [Treponema sp.]|nr:Gldg family protein [Treponema sp.]
MKKFLEWLKSPKSDFALLIIVLILACIAGHNAHLRLDITSQRSYSLSEASKRTVRTLTEPLSVKVFFSDNLPTGYSKVQTYVKDILIEYKGAANKNFSYTIYDMDKPENQKVASSYGLRQIQIQEVKNNEVGFKQVWMGVAITYGDSIEVIDSITNEAGFEYNLTTKIAKIISTTDTLAGISDAITVTLYATDALGNFNINGFSQVDAAVQQAFNEVNKKNLNRLTYLKKAPTDEEEINNLAEKYGLQTVSLRNKDGSNSPAIFGLVLEYQDAFRVIPLSIYRHPLFGFMITGTDEIEENISDSLQNLLSKATQIGYITGHEEAALTDEQGNSLHFVTLLSDMYELKELNLKDEDIPVNLTSIIINGPKSAYSQEELYKIDQFVMRGGNVMIFADPFNMTQGNYYQPATFTPIDSGLNTLLEKYGAKLESNYVFDENCYVARQQGYGNINLWWAPQLSGKQLNQKNPITKNLGYVIFLQAGGLNLTGAKENKDIKLTVLAESSEKGWKESRNIQLNPNMTAPYDKSTENKHELAVLLEGKFESAFEKNPAEEENANSDSNLSTSTHLAKARQSGKIFVTGTSYITSNQLIDEKGSEPVSMMVRNAVDYMNGNSDLCSMRTKGVSFQSISNTSGVYAAIVEYFCIIGLALICAAAGLIVWRKRSLRRRKIHDRYNPDDQREIKE